MRTLLVRGPAGQWLTPDVTALTWSEPFMVQLKPLGAGSESTLHSTETCSSRETPYTRRCCSAQTGASVDRGTAVMRGWEDAAARHRPARLWHTGAAVMRGWEDAAARRRPARLWHTGTAVMREERGDKGWEEREEGKSHTRGVCGEHRLEDSEYNVGVCVRMSSGDGVHTTHEGYCGGYQTWG